VPDVSGTEDVGPPIRGSVQDGIIGEIRQHERSDDHRLNHVGHISQVPSEARRFARSDLIARLQSRIEEYTLDLVKNEPRQNESVNAEDDIEKAQCRSVRAYDGSNKYVGVRV
jgi:hypothetical protein